MGFTQVIIVGEDLYWHFHLEGGLLRKCFWVKVKVFIKKYLKLFYWFYL